MLKAYLNFAHDGATMDYLQPQGFLGTGASLLADLTLLAYVLLLVPGMIAGLVFARRGKHRPHHRMTMTVITVINWLLIFFLMIVAYRFDVVGNLPEQPGNARYLMPTIHGLLGLPAQLLATYVVYRMLREDTQVAAAKARGESKEQLRKYWFLNAKPLMRITLVLWLATALLGVFNYLIRYEVLPSFGTSPVAPLVTEEPVFSATEEASLPEPANTPETLSLEPAFTPEPAVTVEFDDDDNSGMGMGSDDEPGDDNSGMGSD
jgi:uncharacterized membrane protein YozB (DUF420 family)